MMNSITPMVKHLLILNVIFYIGANFLLQPEVSYTLFALNFPLNDNFEWWQLMTHMFMHAKAPFISHLAFNMFGLFMFGSSLEKVWGQKKFLVFYLLSGFGAALLYMGINYFQFNGIYENIISQGATPDVINNFFQTGRINGVRISQEDINKFYEIYHTPTVGASGALYGILVAFAFMFPDVELMIIFLPIPVKAKYFVPFIVLIDFIGGLNGNSFFGYSTGIAHFAHVGGALTGYLIMLYHKKTQFNNKRLY